jgi:hypothetical protein
LESERTQGFRRQTWELLEVSYDEADHKSTFDWVDIALFVLILLNVGLQLIWADALPDSLAAVGVSVERGARGVQSVVRSLVASPIARWLGDHPEATDGMVMVAPRLERGTIASLAIDWVDESGFFLERAN